MTDEPTAVQWLITHICPPWWGYLEVARFLRQRMSGNGFSRDERREVYAEALEQHHKNRRGRELDQKIGCKASNRLVA